MFGNIQNFVLKHFEYVSIDLLLLWREKCQRAHSGAESCWRAPALTPASFGPSGKSHEHCLIPHLRHGTQYLPPTGDTGLSHLQFSRLLEARQSSAPSCTHRATPGTFSPLPRAPCQRVTQENIQHGVRTRSDWISAVFPGSLFNV